MTLSPEHDVDALVGHTAPFLIGVRHHSPALAAVMPALLSAYRPDVLAIELPGEAAEWIDWLSHPQARAPLALAFSAGEEVGFYPFADFSPELAALRWARDNGVEVMCIDLPVGMRGGESVGESEETEEVAPAGWLDALARQARVDLHGGSDTQEVWDRLIEAAAPGASPEQIRRAALAYGWTVRMDREVQGVDLVREEWMRSMLAPRVKSSRIAAVVGAFHVPALLTTPEAPQPDRSESGQASDVRSALVRYSFAYLDSRSGYPSGIRDPEWQQAVFESELEPDRVRRAAAEKLTAVTRSLRASDHPAGPREAAETLRIAIDLATLRGHAAPARRELIEAATSVLAHGEVLGRGRAVASALQEVLVGVRSGQPAPGTPASPLRESLRAELEAVNLPVDKEKIIRLAPLRGGLDLRRHVLLRRLEVGRIVYGRTEGSSTWRSADTVTQEWSLQWNMSTEASVDLAVTRGLSAAQLASTVLLNRELTRDSLVDLLNDSADTASADALERALTCAMDVAGSVDFVLAVTLMGVLSDIATARIPGAHELPASARERAGNLAEEFTGAAVREIAGIAGSDNPADAAALVALSTAASERELSIGSHLHSILESGSPLMQGAAAGLIFAKDPELASADPGELLASWLVAPGLEQRRRLRRRLTGLLVTAGAVVSHSPGLDALVEEVGRIADEEFVGILPALRGGFDTLGEQERGQLINELALRFGADLTHLSVSAEDAAAAARYDHAARGRLAALGLADITFSPAERWRLVLGQQRKGLTASGTRLARALDELYGDGRSDALAGSHKRAGAGTAMPSARVWKEEIEATFGTEAVEEIFGVTAEQGRYDVISELDIESVTPSVELLTTALSIAGAMPEARLGALRRLVARVIHELTKQLAIRLQPALAGITTPRPTLRDTGTLNLPATIRRNLKNVVVIDGHNYVVPATPVFHSRSVKTADWDLIVVVDVSGSMSESVIYSALVAAILAGVPSLKVTFLAFNNSVIDFTDRVDDPLALLLEVEVGGGTDIAGAMRFARSRVTNPTRTLCVLISDFEEYGPPSALLGEVEALASSGVKLIGCAALNDSGTGVYNVGVASQVAAAGMRVAAVSPLDLARWVGEVVRS